MKVSATLLVVLIATLAETQAWTIPTPSSTSASTHLVSRTDVFKQALKKGGAALTIATLMTNTVTAAPSVANAETTSEGVTYEVIKKGDGPQPAIGELVAIRFAAYVAASGNKIDDIFDSPEPYYTRLGSGGLLKGVELTLPNMRLGDRWKLTIPVRIYASKANVVLVRQLTYV